MRHPVLRRDQRLHDLRVQDAAAARDLVQRADHLVDVGHALLQQVAEAFRAVFQQVVGVLLVRELREDDDPDRGMRRPDLAGGADPLVGVRGRHPDVGQHRVGLQRLDFGEQFVVRCGGSDDLHAFVLGEEGRDSLADEVVILGEHDPDHARMVHVGPGRRCA